MMSKKMKLMMVTLSFVSVQVMAVKPGEEKPFVDRNKTTVSAKVAAYQSQSSQARSYDCLDSTPQGSECAFRMVAALVTTQTAQNQTMVKKGHVVDILIHSKGNLSESDITRAASVPLESLHLLPVPLIATSLQESSAQKFERIAGKVAYDQGTIAHQRNKKVNDMLGNDGNHRWSDSYIDQCLNGWDWETDK